MDYVLPSRHHRKNLQNNAFCPTYVHTPIGGIFGGRGDSRCPRTRLTRLAPRTKEHTGPTCDDHIGASGRRGRAGRRLTAEESMDEDGSDRHPTSTVIAASVAEGFQQLFTITHLVCYTYK